LDDEEGLPGKLVIKNQQFHKEGEQPPTSAQPGSSECEHAPCWKALSEMEKQQQDQVDRSIKKLVRSRRWRWRLLAMSTTSC